MKEFLTLLPELAETDCQPALQALQEAFPVMAVWRYCSDFLRIHGTSQETRRKLIMTIQETRETMLRTAVENLGPFHTLLTISHSSLVRDVLLGLDRREERQVILSRALPALEGEVLAGMLLEKGYAVDLVDDWILPDKVHLADAVVLGADMVGSRGFINKTGSAALVARAEQENVPVHVLAEAFKQVDEIPRDEKLFYQDWSAAGIQRHVKVFEWVKFEQTLD